MPAFGAKMVISHYTAIENVNRTFTLNFVQKNYVDWNENEMFLSTVLCFIMAVFNFKS